MRVGRYCTALIIMLLCISSAHSQEYRTEVSFNFRVNSTAIDSIYNDNAARMKEMRTFLQNICRDSTISITKVTFSGAASPEDSYEWNHRLARGRLASLEKLVRRDIKLPDSLVAHEDSYIPWEYLKERVAASDIACKQKVLDILNEKAVFVKYPLRGEKVDSRVVKLQKLNGGRVWNRMKQLYFPSMRNACAVFITYKKAVPPVKKSAAVPDTMATPPAPIVETADTIIEAEKPEPWQRHLYIKTNGIGWAMGITNIAVEIDLAKHWSFTLPFYWSAWNYFKPTLKFRTLALQPEVRYWFSKDNGGWFAGAHFGLAWYNIATCGDYRTQDHGGHSPAIGGGLSAGYRLPVSRNGRWQMEFALGAGCYKLHYDKFHNYKNGLLVDTKKKTWFGIDRAAVSIVYTFDLGKKGGAR